MAKRITIQEREVRKIISDGLNDLGRKISVVAARNSKISKLQKDHLRDSYNYNVKPYDTINISASFYGKYNTPKGKPTPSNRDNLKDTAMLNAIKEFAPKDTKVIAKNIADLLKSPIRKK